jgi:putative addiction module killer protein
MPGTYQEHKCSQAPYDEAERLCTECMSRQRPGCRVYFVQRGSILIILPCGGDKRSQPRDKARVWRLAAELEHE